MKRALAAAVAAVVMLAITPQASATPCCAIGWHWYRASTPFNVTVLMSVTSGWVKPVMGAAADWTASDVLNMTTAVGNTSRSARINCSYTGNYTVHICNANYGNTGWAGLTQAVVNSRHHIVKIRIRVNDATTPAAYRRLVSCHELGHSIGLGHNTRTSSCMRPGTGSRPHPDAIDFAELDRIYAHSDTAFASTEDLSGTRTITVAWR
jgi:predicted Zn-dependent protease